MTLTYAPYYPGGWQDNPSTATPIIAAALQNIENGIALATAASPDRLNVVTQYGASPGGTADSTTAIQNALAAAAPGQIVYFPAGKYLISSPLALPNAGVIQGSAGFAPPSQDAGSVLVMSAAFAGAGAITTTCASGGPVIGGQVRDLGIDGSAAAAGGGIIGTGNVTNLAIDNVAIYKVPGAGIDATVSNGTGSPHGWHVRHVRVDGAGANGINCGTATDCTWDDVHVINSTGHAWSLAGCPANSRFIGCRGEWSGAGKDGWHLVSTWNSSTGSGAVTMTACSTDRNDGHGVNVLATGNVPLILDACMFRRDGRNGGAGGGGFAGINISAATIPVVIGPVAVWPGVDDDGTHSNSPQIGLSVANSAYVQVSGGYIQGNTTAVNNGGSNTAFFVSPAVLTATGTTSAPTVITSSFLSVLNGASLSLKSAGGSSSVLTAQATGSGTQPIGELIANAAADPVLGVEVSADSANRFKMDSNGKMQWGPGSATQDVDLYRPSSGLLQTDQNLTATGYLSASRLIANGITGISSSSRLVGSNSGAPASGTFLTADFFVDAGGYIWVNTAGGAQGTWQKIGSSYLCAPNQYAPGSQTSLTVTGTSLAAFSSGLASTNSFSAPASGNVLVEASFVVQTTVGTGAATVFGIAAHGTTTPACDLIIVNDNTTGIPRPLSLRFYVTGLTPGASMQYDLIGCNASGSSDTVQILAFGTTTSGTTRGGPVIMTVQAA